MSGTNPGPSSCVYASEMHEQARLRAPFLELGREIIAVCFGGGGSVSQVPLVQFVQVNFVGFSFLSSESPRGASVMVCNTFPFSGAKYPHPPGGCLDSTIWKNPCFFPPSAGSHPLFTHWGGCYSLWQQGPWQPASHLGEATLLPW